MASPDPVSPDGITALYANIRRDFPSTLPTDAWYLLTTAALVACGRPQELSSLYLDIVKKDGSASLYRQEQVSQRLRDVLMKEWTLVGIPLVITGVAALAAVESVDFKSNLSEKWSKVEVGGEVEARGTSFIQKLYKQDLSPIFATWGSHQDDFEWLEKSIIYGLFLSDHTLLSELESEIVILTSIMCQGLRAPTIWHLRGLRRLGVDDGVIDEITDVIHMIARYCGKDPSGWALIRDVPKDSDS